MSAGRLPVVLSGGCFQNRILFEKVNDRLKAEDFTVLARDFAVKRRWAKRE
jgi:hydrogenase maturation factor HypF (carbamoyltransferase family)